MPDDSMFAWKQASYSGILVDEANDVWWSGHVSDIVEWDDADAFAASTETGGVWSIAGSGGPLPLSDTWDTPDVATLAKGPDGPRHLFAGCSDRYRQDLTQTVPTIMESRAGAAVSLLDWVPTTALPADAGAITRIVVVRNLRLIVVACAKQRTDDRGGIFWSRIPPSSFPPNPPPRPAYSWRRAMVDGEPPDGFSDLVIAATNGHVRRDDLENLADITFVAGGRSGGIFVGRLVGNALTMAPAYQHSGDVQVTVMAGAGATSVASCSAAPNVVYGACAKSDGRLMQVVRSEDGGQTWQACGSGILGSDQFGRLLALAGSQGNDWNNRIAVAPYDPGLVALGWKAGPFISRDGGGTWEELPDSGGHVHADLHALLFSAKTTAGNRTLYVGGDGGMASIDLDQAWSGGPAAFRSNYNRDLPTLQCYAPVIRQFYGGMDASRTQPGLVSVGLQDNGNVFARLNAGPTPWVQLAGGDGGSNRFLADGALVSDIMGVRADITTFDDPATIKARSALDVTNPPSPDGLVGGMGTENVVRPTYRNAAGQLLTAMAAVGNNVLGLYIDDDNAPRYHWEILAMLPAGASVSALGSFGGGTVFAGTSGDGRMFAIDVEQGSVLQLPVQLPKAAPARPMGGGTFVRIVAFNQSDVFAILDAASEQGLPSGVTGSSHSYVVRLDSLRFVPTLSVGLTGELMYGIATVPAPETGASRGLVVSTDAAVYVSRDDGASWARASSGLPRRPHCSELRTVVDADHRINVYLGTYGRSVWTVRFGYSDG